MTESRQPQINEELLSAYLDDEVTAEERALVEAAIAADPAVAWQVESLRQTIHLLAALPPLALPRTFTLEAIVTDGQTAPTIAVASPPDGAKLPGIGLKPNATKPTPRAPQTTTVAQPSWWQWFWQIWQGGNLQLRNAAAVAFTLLIVFMVSDRIVTPTQRRPTDPATTSLVTVSAPSTNTAPMAAPVVLATATAQPDLATTTPPSNTPNTFSADTTTTGAASTSTGSPMVSTGPTNPSAAKMPPVQGGSQGEDNEDLTGAQQNSARSSAVQTTNSAMTVTKGNSALASSQETTADAMSSTVTQAAVSPVTAKIATMTITPTVTVTVTAVISDPAQTEITNTTTLTVAASINEIAPPATSNSTQPWLTWAEILAGICTVVLGSLWWRSRGLAHA